MWFDLNELDQSTLNLLAPLISLFFTGAKSKGLGARGEVAASALQPDVQKVKKTCCPSTAKAQI